MPVGDINNISLNLLLTVISISLSLISRQIGCSTTLYPTTSPTSLRRAPSTQKTTRCHPSTALFNKTILIKTIKDVGIVFASLVNFNELYDESYMGGKEFLRHGGLFSKKKKGNHSFFSRVLNELISDFDELLDQVCPSNHNFTFPGFTFSCFLEKLYFGIFVLRWLTS